MARIPWRLVAGCERFKVLDREFYERPTEQVARELLGKLLVHELEGERLAGRIVEVEAYLGEHDPAAHASAGRTRRTAVLYGPGGHAYVYLIYGMYECLNLVAEGAGSPGCVLIRALEPVAGIDQMRRRRQVQDLRQLASGPGKLTRAMGITRAHTGVDVTRGVLTVQTDGVEPEEIVTGPRIGVRKAADWPLRFSVAWNQFVSRG
ncbi:MAG: DNA-3-methyladenine glycosylase [Bryobacteraceae bacterium]|nr:DNA-3-methyladenine glycosylase [Bryobacteraceae bacterium]MDW8376551.1 DNA-3-methyladenine glycosylase [Bryobacterales bacterium]